MFIDVEAARRRLEHDKEALDGIFTSLGYREGVYWVEHDASKGELEFVSNPGFYRTIRERAKVFNGGTASGLNVPMEVLYNQFGLSAVFRKILADRTREDFPGDAIIHFEQGFVDAVRELYPYVVDESNPSEPFSGSDDGESGASSNDEVPSLKEEDGDNGIHGAQKG
ncbi:MAG: hypothetical protein FDZ69_12415 [Deltaproteobacteria bacterium]|nr:MAG: hypothetical protein FDZ69_12415 [Deltaproteobacteria bacterium]